MTNSIAEGLTFCYQMLYLVDRSPYYSPILHLLRQNIVRVSGNELVSSQATLSSKPFIHDNDSVCEVKRVESFGSHCLRVLHK